MQNHEKVGFHIEAMKIGDAFQTSLDIGLNVVQMGNTALQTQILRNRQLLRSIVETIILCSRQNIPLRGHRDDGPLEKCRIQN